MYLDMKLVKVVAIIALVLVVAAGIMLLFRNVGQEPEEPSNILTPNQILYGMNYQKTVEYDFDTIRRHIESKEEYAEYTLRDEYLMVYQITNEENEKKIKEYLGIRSELPNVDYKKNFLFLSVGKEVYDVGTKGSMIDRDGLPILDIIYSETPYVSGKVFVYI